MSVYTAANTVLNTSGGTSQHDKKRKGRWWFCGTAVIAGESKHCTGADLCGLSLVKQGRANGLEILDSKVSLVDSGGVMAQVCV